MTQDILGKSAPRGWHLDNDYWLTWPRRPGDPGEEFWTGMLGCQGHVGRKYVFARYARHARAFDNGRRRVVPADYRPLHPRQPY